MITKIISLWLKNRSEKTIWILITAMIVGCWMLGETNILIEYIGQILIPILVKITISLFLLSIGLLLSLVVIHRRPTIKDYEIINPPGFIRHKKTGAYFCQPCLRQRHIASELSIISQNEFYCRVCKESYRVDYSVLICDEYLSMVHDRAAKELIHKKANV